MQILASRASLSSVIPASVIPVQAGTQATIRMSDDASAHDVLTMNTLPTSPS